MVCPKCGFDQPATALECARCGVVFSKLSRETHSEGARGREVARSRDLERNNRTPRDPATSQPRDPAPLPDIAPDVIAFPADEEEDVRNGRFGSRELAVLGGGLVAAVAVYAMPFTRMVFSIIVTLFHEFGHAVVGWILGFPSLPAFDFVYGGGWTHYGSFRTSIAVAVAAIFAYGIWLFRENRRSAIAIGVLSLMWLLAVSGEWRRELVVAAAGHTAEFVLAGIFFYMALSGVGLRIPEIERPLAAFVAFFVQFHSMGFAWRLMHDPDFLAWYREGKGGAVMNDLEVVSLNLNIYAKMQTTIQGVAGLLFVFSLVPIAVAVLWYLQRARVHRLLRAMRTAD